ncbi:hypothetical protein [Glycomyces sp. YM15]|uniref:hypothetical protein n=1 Tax=Glycomyces sp. YM15 TaxID=2800446 RepID=UPI001964F421|nr:hypothetical protein [Glycomyces sp. YM15]
MSDRPRFGYGRRGRPLWDERAFVAELIRRTLRRAWFRECGEFRLGFAVEGGHVGEDGKPMPFNVVCADDKRTRDGIIAKYERTLVKAGWRIVPNVYTGDDDMLCVDATYGLSNPPAWLARSWARLGSAGYVTSDSKP